MWFIWRLFDLAAVTSPGYIFNTRENSSKRQKSIKIWGLPLSKPGRGIGGVKRMFHHRRSESTVNWSCGIQQRAEQLCLIYTKPSSAEWLGDHFWDVLLLKADFLHDYEREWPWGAILHSQERWPSPSLMGTRVLWEGSGITNCLTQPELWGSEQLPSHSHYQTIRLWFWEAIAPGCLRAPWLAQVEMGNT